MRDKIVNPSIKLIIQQDPGSQAALETPTRQVYCRIFARVDDAFFVSFLKEKGIRHIVVCLVDCSLCIYRENDC